MGHALLALLLTAFFTLTGCSPPEVPEQAVRSAYPWREIDHHMVPELPSAAEQFNYAMSSFSQLLEKQAALRAVGAVHPGDRRHGALAALELAYLQLGEDYRLSTAVQYRDAVAQYQRILALYPDLAEIDARARWYLGWISADLLGDPAAGIAYFNALISAHPEEQLSLPPPAPWLTINLAVGDSGQHHSPPTPAVLWADLARLEIIRHGLDPELARQHLDALAADYSSPRLFTRAVATFINRYGLDEPTRQVIDRSLRREDLAELQRRDLENLLTPKQGGQ